VIGEQYSVQVEVVTATVEHHTAAAIYILVSV
jgi:hypothetical protein